mgnify:CR=1 FL=1|jgi:hypothetical protein|tara:strand:+ start:722 stop:1135 length:414 start_codon:yes stop_codon:yes gene_type:complete
MRNIFDWLNEITITKRPVNDIPEESWEKWNSYMMHRYLSMYVGYVEIVNYVQKINPQSKKQIYNIYRQLIPKKKIYLKYIKNLNKKSNQELIEYISSYFKCGLAEADNYINILPLEEIKNILFEMGVDEKDHKKLIK